MYCVHIALFVIFIEVRQSRLCSLFWMNVKVISSYAKFIMLHDQYEIKSILVSVCNVCCCKLNHKTEVFCFSLFRSHSCFVARTMHAIIGMCARGNKKLNKSKPVAGYLGIGNRKKDEILSHLSFDSTILIFIYLRMRTKN